jgi:hypothetical protein
MLCEAVGGKHITEKQYTTDHNTKHVYYTIFPVLPMVAQLVTIFPNFMELMVHYTVHENVIQHSPKAWIPQYLTSSINYGTPQNASFSAYFLCLLFKHYSHHYVLKHSQLVNGKKHSQVLKDLFNVNLSIHLLTIHIWTNKMD